MPVARARFEAALIRCPEDTYAMTGLGYVALREGSEEEADSLWSATLTIRPDDADALVGLGLVAWRQGDLALVRERFLGVIALRPDDPTALDYLGRLPQEELDQAPDQAPDRPALVRPDTLEYPARTRGDRFEVRTAEGWRPFYIKGINLGAALPGRHPSEFTDSATYAAWFAGMAEMNANAVRVYTIHPPAFYEALLDHNSRYPEQALWLIHGVWTEPPEEQGHNYLDPAFEGAFFTEMRRVVDLVHGRADVLPRPGHAAGFYTADVSEWTLAYIIGREWEPYSALAFDSIQPDFSSWDGRYVRLEGGNALETWMAKATDEIVTYESETYHAQRPVAYTNWPTLDPLDHPTETTRDEEVALREALGERVVVRPREYDNDAIGLDAAKMEATDAFQAGLFASFHVYPYYPDFMVLQPSYNEATSSLGRSNYFGYLQELKARHQGIPVVVSEYGVPASWGSAHLQPQGWHHGGLSEAAMAEIDHRMTLELAEAGMAGGVVFAWIDEWFKKNWMVIDFELPGDRNRMWYNRLDAEQHYGMIAIEAEPPVSGESLAERREVWDTVPALYSGPTGTVRAASDAAYLWLLVDVPDRARGSQLFVGLDILRPEAGDRRWPGGEGPELPVGAEFVVVDEGNVVRVLADPAVNPFRLVPVGEGTAAPEGPVIEIDGAPANLFRGRLEQRLNAPFISVPNADGRYDTLRVISNRRRLGRDSLEYLAVGYERGLLPRGPAPDGFWERDGTALEVRIPWLMINVTDPSSRRVLVSPEKEGAGFGRTPDGRVVMPSGTVVAGDTIIEDLGTVVVPDIGIVAGARHSDGSWIALPVPGEAPARFTWDTWESDSVRWRARRRPAFTRMQDLFATLRPYGGSDVVASARAAGAQRDAPRPEPRRAPDVDSADVAWRAGEQDRAVRIYLQRLASDPNDEVALHRVGLTRAWVNDFSQAFELLGRLVDTNPANLDGRVDLARVKAWSGDVSGGIADLDALLEEHPDYTPAVEARATFRAWEGEYDEALSSYDDLLAITAGEASVRRGRAQILTWASELEASRAVYDSVLALDPGDVEARLGLAQTLTFADSLDAAAAQYRVILSGDPEEVRALQGLGRALSWGGSLVAGEEAFRTAVSRAPTDVASLVALAENLRWQGRDASALDVLIRAEHLAPDHRGVREQRRMVDVALGTSLRPSLVVEDDSDDNHMVTASAAGSWHPTPRLGLRAHSYQRSLTQGQLSRDAFGLTVSGSYQLQPGWTVSAGLGGSRSDGGDRTSVPAYSLGVSSPGRYSYGAGLSVGHQALDATAVLADRGVSTTETRLTGRWAPAAGWRLNVGVGSTSYAGTEDNHRSDVSLTLSRRFGRPWTLAVGGRAMGFDKDLSDGYFDPDFYGIAEVRGRWQREFGRWSFLAEAAPGFQRVGSDGDPTGAFRASGRAGYRLAPGRELTLSAGYSSTGLQSFSTGGSDYRYTAVIVGGSWVF
jgi:tetratricopeptide (TPR) repeat protein